MLLYHVPVKKREIRSLLSPSGSTITLSSPAIIVRGQRIFAAGDSIENKPPELVA
jgi:nitrous oxidase accessory protein NosD